MDDAIVNWCKTHHKLMIGQQTAEEVKLEVGSATELREEVQDRDPRPRHRLRPAEDGDAEHRGGPRGAPRPGRIDRRRGQGDARPDSARARRRHHGPRHHARRRRIAAPGLRRAPPRGVPDAGAARRLAADLRCGRLRSLARGVRDDPPGQRQHGAAAGGAEPGSDVSQAGTPAPRDPRGPRRRLPDADQHLDQRGRGRSAAFRAVRRLVGPFTGRRGRQPCPEARPRPDRLVRRDVEGAR